MANEETSAMQPHWSSNVPSPQLVLLCSANNHKYILLDASKKQRRQVNGKIQKGHIGIVEKALTNADTGIHGTVPLLYNMNSKCVLKCRDTLTSHCRCHYIM